LALGLVRLVQPGDVIGHWLTTPAGVTGIVGWSRAASAPVMESHVWVTRTRVDLDPSTAKRRPHWVVSLEGYTPLPSLITRGRLVFEVEYETHRAAPCRSGWSHRPSDACRDGVRVGTHLVLPDAEGTPAVGFEQSVCLGIALLIADALRKPELSVAGGCLIVLGASVPKASVDEDRDARSPEDDVRCSS